MVVAPPASERLLRFHPFDLRGLLVPGLVVVPLLEIPPVEYGVPYLLAQSRKVKNGAECEPWELLVVFASTLR